MYCSVCGEHKREGNLFCTKCGTSLERSSQVQAEGFIPNEFMALRFLSGIIFTLGLSTFAFSIGSIFYGLNQIEQQIKLIYISLGIFGFILAFSIMAQADLIKLLINIENHTDYTNHLLENRRE